MDNFKYIYGPVESWRMGKSLGIDPLSDKAKICNLDCVYCQLGKTSHLCNDRKEYVPTEAIMEEINSLPALMDIDYFTFSGRGEPTLASNLGDMIRTLKESKRSDVAVITNSTLLHLPQVQNDLSLADYVIAKLDACDETSFLNVDKAIKSISFEKTINGIRDFRERYHGTLALQVMFVGENKKHALEIADIARSINADEIQINTPLRPSLAKALDEKSIREIKTYFAGMPFVTVYDRPRKESNPIDVKGTVKRHGYFKGVNDDKNRIAA